MTATYDREPTAKEAQSEGETRTTWGIEVGLHDSSSHPGGDRGAGPSGGRLRDLASRVVGENREGAASVIISALVLSGGILQRLIAQTTDQLREARECVVWYQRKEEELSRELENLNQLHQELQRQLGQGSEPPAEQ